MHWGKGYTGVYGVYHLDFLKENCIPYVSQKRYCVYNIGYTLYLERMLSVSFFTTTTLDREYA